MTGGKAFEWKVALILFGVLFLGVSDTQLVPPLLSSIANEFQTSAGHTGIIVTSYSLAAAVFALFAGPLSDRIGRKKVLVGGLALFTAASFSTQHVTTLGALLVVRTLTGFAAGTLSTCALSFAGDHYSYQQRGRAMGLLSMAYFLAFVVSAPAGALMAPVWGWHSIFGGLAALGAAMFILAVWKLPASRTGHATAAMLPNFHAHFAKPERLAGMVAAFLTSGGVVGFLTYVGAWLIDEQKVGTKSMALTFMISGIAAVAAAPLSGWLADHAGKRRVIIWANILLAPIFLVVARLEWGWVLWSGIALLGVAASARQAPLHALTTEIVGAEIRGEYTAMRNAASQIGIASAAAISSFVFDASGFAGVSIVAAVFTALVPVSCIWLRER
ncbi:MAG TPA: MFS transporter [Terriglobia bacterium]|nr:MFS transporter [Terriglobia bacterium]